MAAAGRANASRAIPIRRPDEASVPSSPRPEVAPAVVINANSEPMDTEAIQNKLKGLSVASAPPFVPKQSSSTVKGLNAASADFNPNSRPFTPPSQPRTSQLQPTAPDFTFSTSDSNTSGQPDFQPQLSPFEDAGLRQQGPTTLGTQDMFNPYADPIPQGSFSHEIVQRPADAFLVDAVDPSQNYYDPGLNRPEPYMQRAPVSLLRHWSMVQLHSGVFPGLLSSIPVASAARVEALSSSNSYQRILYLPHLA